jgi:hypothetical protein
MLEIYVSHLKIMSLCALILLAFVLGVVALQLLGSRWRRLRVFVTYQNAVAELAEEITEALKKHGLNAEFIPFVEREHDKLIEEVLQRIRSCNAVVAVPGETRSFIDSELLTASGLRKPIVIIKHRPSQTLPDTAYSGYPVFNLNDLRRYDHRPLKHFILYMCNYWSDVLLNLIRVLRSAGKSYWIFAVSILCLFIEDFADFFLMPSLPNYAYYAGILTYWVIFGALVTVFVFSFACAVIDKFRAIRTMKQNIVNRAFTYERLQEALSLLKSDRDILSCIEREPLALRHTH